MFGTFSKRCCLQVAQLLPTIRPTMRRMKHVKVATAILLLSGLATGLSAQLVAADTNTSPSLVITQLKVSSNGQFVTLYNVTDTVLDMSQYQLEYFNNYDLSKATSSKLVALTGSLPPHGYYMVNDSQSLLCYQLTVDSVSLGWSTTAGLVEVLALAQTNPGNSVSSVLQDYVGWSKIAANGAQTLPIGTTASLLRQPLTAEGKPEVDTAGSGSWLAVQPDTTDACNYVTVANPPTKVESGNSQLFPPSQPPVIVLSSNSADTGEIATTLNAGLMAPQLTELLPNPLGTGNDGTDEFIEIYNANPVAFDLSGYSLKVGTISVHSYVFPSGSSLPPLSFTAYYASQTGLSLSNSGGQAELLDPVGASISKTAVYGTANDGQAWALVNANWSWTSVPTPGTVNVINQPANTKTAIASSSAQLPAATTNTVSSNTAAVVKSTTSVASLTPIHSWTLALIASLALLYGAYEYRVDLGNRIHQFRKYLRHRRADRTTFTWRRSHRTSQ